MKKLWTADVTINFEMPIYAESLEEALKIAKKNAREEFENHGEFDVGIMDMAPSGEFNDSYPYGSPADDEGDLTVGELKKKLGVQHPLEARMAKLSEALKAKAGQ